MGQDNTCIQSFGVKTLGEMFMKSVAGCDINSVELSGWLVTYLAINKRHYF
jgi:hypothetical protein